MGASRTGPLPNHKPLGDVRWIVIGMWPSHAPQAYCFESGLRQASAVCKMTLDRRGIDIRPLTPEATLKRMGLSFLLPRSGEMRPVQLSGLPIA